jgi:fermentation-respiration switch protein FrsA (DUF1100 family)
VRPHAGPKALIYFAGNAEDVSASLASFSKAFPEYAIYLLHYRGYGGSSGQPSEKSAACGRARLVLVTPYDSIEEIAAQQFPYFPVRWLLTDKFESSRYAPAIRVPTLLLQAEHDEVIASSSTERLNATFAKGIASLVIIRRTGHNTIADKAQYLDAMRAVL